MSLFYPCIKENRNYGTIALFTSASEGIVLYKGSSWIKEGANVENENFSKTLVKVTLKDNSSNDERELIFLKACNFDTSCGYWSDDINRYKKERTFLYEFIMGYGKIEKEKTTQENNMMIKFKVGDKVKKFDGKAFSNGGFVTTVDKIDGFNVRLKELGTWIYEEGLVKTFTKSDLKDGMVVTYRNENERIVFKNTLYLPDEDDTLMSRITLAYYNNDLMLPDYSSMDIMKVTYMDEVLWEREEETAEQKRIKELEGGIARMQEELDNLMEVK